MNLKIFNKIQMKISTFKNLIMKKYNFLSYFRKLTLTLFETWNLKTMTKSLLKKAWSQWWFIYSFGITSMKNFSPDKNLLLIILTLYHFLLCKLQCLDCIIGKSLKKSWRMVYFNIRVIIKYFWSNWFQVLCFFCLSFRMSIMEC